MNFHRDEQLEQVLLKYLTDSTFEDRKEQWPGVTNLIFCLTKAFYDRKKHLQTGKLPEHSETTQLMFAVGLGLEKALISNWKEGELAGEYEGIWYHIDGHYEDSVLEVKSTRRRSITGREPNKVIANPTVLPEHWLKQIKAYCKVSNKTTAKLAVMHIIEPVLSVWEIAFTPLEILDNWSWLKRRKIVLEAAMLVDKPPAAFEYNMPWECEDCPWRLFCNLEAGKL